MFTGGKTSRCVCNFLGENKTRQKHLTNKWDFKDAVVCFTWWLQMAGRDTLKIQKWIMLLPRFASFLPPEVDVVCLNNMVVYWSTTLTRTLYMFTKSMYTIVLMRRPDMTDEHYLKIFKSSADTIPDFYQYNVCEVFFYIAFFQNGTKRNSSCIVCCLNTSSYTR